MQKSHFTEEKKVTNELNNYQQVKISSSNNNKEDGKILKKWIIFILIFLFLIIIVFVIVFNLKKRSFKWENEKLVLHALGEMNNCQYTNSIEALNYWYHEKKMYLMEADFQLTKDNHVVLAHDFLHLSQTPNLTEFKKSKSKGNLTPMTFEDLVKFMYENKKLYIITDSKYDDPEHIIIEFDEMTNILKKYKGVSSKFIIQIYNENMYKILKERNYPFKNFLFTLYLRWDPNKGLEDLEKIFEFCKKNKIKGVVIWINFFKESIIEISKKYSIPVYFHSENNIDKIYELLQKGAKGIYTDNVDNALLNKYIKNKKK